MFSSTIATLAAAATESDRPVTVLIDGPSGAGKTTLAAELESAWPAGRMLAVLHLDDIYPGWKGLDSASMYVRDSIMVARLNNEAVRWQSWNWATNAPGKWNAIPADVDLVIEGCGAITYQAARAASASVWVDCDDDTRKKRALGRGDEDFEAHWDEWDEQFRVFVNRENPQAHASLSVGANR